MKIFLSESLVQYNTYTFNYALYCLLEHDKEIPDIYNLGFLPYSNDLTLDKSLFYMARSLRVNLSDFKETSENRRVLKKIEELKPGFRVIPIEQFDTEQDSFRSFCYDFANERFSEPISKERIEYILKWKNLSHVFEFSLDDKKVGYVLCIMFEGTLHYWFAFFDLNYPAYSLGKYIMYSVINWAFEQKMESVYLGTCYGEKALYKARDFKGLEFFDGNIWNSDMKLLKEKCKNDAHVELDHFKRDKNYFLKNN